MLRTPQGVRPLLPSISFQPDFLLQTGSRPVRQALPLPALEFHSRSLSPPISTIIPMDIAAIENTVRETISAVREMDFEPTQGFKSLWPTMWCEWASIAIAEVLHLRGQGDWTFVQASLPDDGGGHAWLELRDERGAVLYSIDATLHQFKRHPRAFWGPGRSPAAGEFTDVRFEGNWRDWPILVMKPVYNTFTESAIMELRKRNLLTDVG